MTKAAPPAKKALNDFTNWLKDDWQASCTGPHLAFGKDCTRFKFRYVMETYIDPAKLLAEAEAEVSGVRGEMLQLALPLYKEMYPGQDDFGNLPAQERENKIIVAVWIRIGEEHPQRAQLMAAVQGDLAGITQFITTTKRLLLSAGRTNLKSDPDAGVPARVYSVAGFHSPPAGSRPRGAILGDADRSEDARGQSRKQAARVQQLHLEMAEHA